VVPRGTTGCGVSGCGSPWGASLNASRLILRHRNTRGASHRLQPDGPAIDTAISHWKHLAIEEAAAAPAEAFWLYALPPRMRATHGRAAHATVSHVTAAAGHTQATGEATNEACPGALREAEQALIHKLRLCTSAGGRRV
jgi:hypothetical protein